MEYKEDEFVLIKDDDFKAKKFIGQIILKVKNEYKLYVYIFPEDTIDGRKPYMSSNEVFLTTTQILYYLSGIDEQKVEVVKMDEYINKKYIKNEKLELPLYFFRQTYIIEQNKFIPEILPRICYCKEIFNPDIPFKRCKCGKLFHIDCFIQSQESKCWSEDCDFNCNTLLSEEEKLQKARIISGELKEANTIMKELEKEFNNEIINKLKDQENNSINNYNIYNNVNNNDNNNDNYNDNYNDNNDSSYQKKINDKNKDNFSYNSQDYENNYHNNDEININVNKNINNDNDNEKNDNNNDEINIIEKEERMRLLEELEKKDNPFLRDSAKLLIFDIFKRCLIIIKNNLSLIERYKKYEDKKIYKLITNCGYSKIKNYIKKLTINLENNLYNNNNSYSDFINKYKEIKLNNIDFLIQVILTNYNLDEINKNQNEDLLFKKEDLKDKRENEMEIEDKEKNISDDIEMKDEKNKNDSNSNNIDKLVITQKMDGSWEANEDNMKCLNMGYKDLDDFKNKNKNSLDELFGEDINDDLLMTIVIICYIENFYQKEKVKIKYEKAKVYIKKKLKIFNKQFIKKFINKIFIK